MWDLLENDGIFLSGMHAMSRIFLGTGFMKKKGNHYQYNSKEWDESKSVEVIPEKKSNSDISTSIRLPSPMIRKLKKVALKKGEIGYQTLIKIWNVKYAIECKATY